MQLNHLQQSTSLIVELQKEVRSTQNSQTVKKSAAHEKKQHKESCEIKGGSPEVAVVV